MANLKIKKAIRKRDLVFDLVARGEIDLANRIVKAKKGKGSYTRKQKHSKKIFE